MDTNEEKKTTVVIDRRFDDENASDNKPKKLKSWQKGLLIFLAIVLVIVLGTAKCTSSLNNFFAPADDEVEVTDFDYDYIGVVEVDGTISEVQQDTYNHQFVLDTIDNMIEDVENKGMILYINSPGGTVYASDELYFKILEYKEETGNPVYASMQSQATSGGYYVAAPCDKIFANRNCWTGSIGVTMGTFIDISEFLDNLGIKTETITSGDNKAMGSSVEEMTEEQRDIFQSLIDEAYEQFVGIVADGRGLSVKEVKKVADGRILTAKQALEEDLIDEIGTYEEAVAAMQKDYDLDCDVEVFEDADAFDLLSLFSSVESVDDLNKFMDADTIRELVALNGQVTLEYKAEIQK